MGVLSVVALGWWRSVDRQPGGVEVRGPSSRDVAEGVPADGHPSLVALSPGDDESWEVDVAALDDLPPSTLTLRWIAADDTVTTVQTADLPAIDSGDGVLATFPIREAPVGDVGVTAVVATGEQQLGAGFVAIRATDNGLVVAPTLGLLDQAELDADRAAGRIDEAEYQRRLSELHRVPGSEDSVVQ